MTRIKRGTIFADKCCFRMQFPNRPESRFEFPLHSYPETKNTAGFILTEKMDAIDLFIGSEGILGIITEVEIRLIPKPENRLYTVVWLPDEKQAIKLVSKIRESNRLEILALEYFDKHSIEILKKRRNQEGSSSSIPHLDFKANAAVFFDCIYADENELIEISAEFSSILSNQNLSLDDTWSGLDDSDLRRMKALRHALPETINMIIAERKKQCPDLHKISTDFAVPNDSLNEMLDIYHRAMKKASLEYVIFGHIGNNHLHMNILPKNATELKLAKELYIELAFEAVRLGGTVSAEHGIGRLKRHLMPVQYPPEMINAMRTLKNIFDPKGLLNPGVLLPESNVS
ncbi:hypothetical protein KKB99_01235 [bacterium]|nr:hypothetical protein [bacterium]MBU1024609.1 hypothetical protein [bacterium]